MAGRAVLVIEAQPVWRASPFSGLGPLSGRFSDPDNWVGGRVPGPNDTAVFASEGTYTVTFDRSVSNKNLQVFGGNVTFDLDGHIYDLTATGPGDEIEVAGGGLTVRNGTLRAQDADLTGKRVAVIGTGASAIQIVPAIAGRVEHLDVYQRTAPWILPRADREYTTVEHLAFKYVPGAQRLSRALQYLTRETQVVGLAKAPAFMKPLELAARTHIRRQIADPELRRKVTPDFQIGCKRMLISNNYYPALARPNVDLVTDGIAEVTADGIVTRDGTTRQVDAIVVATGFHVTDSPTFAGVFGKDGRSLAECLRIPIDHSTCVSEHSEHCLPLISEFARFLSRHSQLGPSSAASLFVGPSLSLSFLLRRRRRRLDDRLRVWRRSVAARSDLTNLPIDVLSRGNMRCCPLCIVGHHFLRFWWRRDLT